MQKEYEKFKELLEKKKTYKEELQADTEAKQKEVLELDEAYKQALTSNNDKQADTLQDKIYDLKKVIKRNQDKLSLVGTGSDNELEQQALNVLEESNTGIEKLNKEAHQIADEYHELRHALLTKVIELEKHRSKGSEYRQAMGNVIRNVEDFAKNESKKPQSKLRYMLSPRGEAINSYNYPASNPSLKPVEWHQIQQAKAGMYKI